MRHNSSSSKTLYDLGKRSLSKCTFWDFGLLAWKVTKFFMSFYKPRVSFPLNFALSFSVMTRNSSETFLLKRYILWTKRARQNTIFQTFECSYENSPNSSCHFRNRKVRVYSSFASQFSVMKDNSSVFFHINLIYFGQKETIKVKFLDLWKVGWKNRSNSSCHTCNHKSVKFFPNL